MRLSDFIAKVDDRHMLTPKERFWTYAPINETLTGRVQVTFCRRFHSPAEERRRILARETYPGGQFKTVAEAVEYLQQDLGHEGYNRVAKLALEEAVATNPAFARYLPAVGSRFAKRA